MDKQPLFSPPAHQPMKKQRATETPDRLAVQTDDAISRRKAELARLQQQLPGNRPNVNGQTDLLSRARMSLSNTAAGGAPTGPRPPPLPGQQPMIEKRTSDLYPEAPKTAARPGPPRRDPTPEDFHTAARLGLPHGNPSPMPAGTTPETAKVVRRLDVTFASNRQSVSPPSVLRSKSAPPQRPPPPGPPPVIHSEDPENSRPPPPPPVNNLNMVAPPTQATARPPPPPPPGAKPSAAPPTQQQQPPPPPPVQQTAPSVSFAPEVLPEPAREEPPEVLSPAPPTQSSGMDIDFGSDSHDNDFHVASSNEEAPPPMQTPEAHAAKPAQRRSTPYFARSNLDLSQGSEDDDDVAEGGSSGVGTQEPTTPNTIDLLRRESDHQEPPHSTIFTGSASSAAPDSSVDLRLAKELTRAEQEKAHALGRVSELEKMLEELQLQQHEAVAGGNGSASYGVLFDKINQLGMDAALDWARQQTSMHDSNGGDYFFEQNTTSKLTHRKSSMPRPKQSQEVALDMDVLVETVKQLPFEFIDDKLGVSFIVRRPYGIEDDRELWISAGQVPSKGYATRASVMKSPSVEVAARIQFDGSVLALYDEGNVRHQNPLGDWEDFGNAYEREGPLGMILYMDKVHATQGMYSLDDIFDSAIAVRQFYCHSILSAAAGLKRGRAWTVPVLPVTSEAAASPGKDIGVDTNDLPKPKPAETKTKQASPPPAEEGQDVASLFFNMLLSGIVSLLWNIGVALPLRILFNAVAMAAAVGILALVWAYFEHGSGAAHLGSPIDLMFNQPGIM